MLGPGYCNVIFLLPCELQVFNSHYQWLLYISVPLPPLFYNYIELGRAVLPPGAPLLVCPAILKYPSLGGGEKLVSCAAFHAFGKVIWPAHSYLTRMG